MLPISVHVSVKAPDKRGIHIIFFLFLHENKMRVPEQQIILGAFGYLTPLKFSQLGKITLIFFSLSKDTPKMKSNWEKLIKHKERAQEKPDLGI